MARSVRLWLSLNDKNSGGEASGGQGGKLIEVEMTPPTQRLLFIFFSFGIFSALGA